MADKLALIAGARAAVGCGDREFDEIVVVGGGTRIPAVKVGPGDSHPPEAELPLEDHIVP